MERNDFYMFIKLFETLKSTFKNLDKKNLNILLTGLKICFFILLFSIAILITYLLFIHNYLIYQIGLMVFQMSIYFAIACVISTMAIDSIKSKT